jgi:hypothetical protein
VFRGSGNSTDQSCITDGYPDLIDIWKLFDNLDRNGGCSNRHIRVGGIAQEKCTRSIRVGVRRVECFTNILTVLDDVRALFSYSALFGWIRVARKKDRHRNVQNLSGVGHCGTVIACA